MAPATLRWISSACFAAIIPTVASMMWPQIEPTTGYWLIGVSAATGFGCLVLSFVLPQSKDAPPNLSTSDYSEIDKLQYFTLNEMASFWGCERASIPLSRKAKKRFSRMEADIESKKLSVIRDDLREVIADAYNRVHHGKKTSANPKWRITRDDAMAYAGTISERPAFLFPKERAKL
jgi:hypothetical protein